MRAGSRRIGAWDRARVAPMAAALGVVVACGGTEGARPSPPEAAEAGPPEDPCVAAPRYELRTIDDFEAGFDASRWWVGAETTPACRTVRPTVLPRPSADCTQPGSNGTNLRDPDPIADPACPATRASQRGVHVQARGLREWGGNLTYSFAFDGDTSLWADASAWDGVAFWVRLGAGSEGAPVGRTLFVSVGDPGTDAKGGRCSADEGAPLAQKCDPFGAGVGIEAGWRLVAIPFGRMRQRGFGAPSPALDKSKIRTIVLGFDVGDWDFWIDDIAFFRSKSK